MKSRRNDTASRFWGRPPRRGRGLKYYFVDEDSIYQSSPPSQGAWIEILSDLRAAVDGGVAPLAGGVD